MQSCILARRDLVMRADEFKRKISFKKNYVFLTPLSEKYIICIIHFITLFRGNFILRIQNASEITMRVRLFL